MAPTPYSACSGVKPSKLNLSVNPMRENDADWFCRSRGAGVAAAAAGRDGADHRAAHAGAAGGSAARGGAATERRSIGKAGSDFPWLETVARGRRLVEGPAGGWVVSGAATPWRRRFDLRRAGGEGGWCDL